jgi:hypothetical protein
LAVSVRPLSKDIANDIVPEAHGLIAGRIAIPVRQGVRQVKF